MPTSYAASSPRSQTISVWKTSGMAHYSLPKTCRANLSTFCATHLALPLYIYCRQPRSCRLRAVEVKPLLLTVEAWSVQDQGKQITIIGARGRQGRSDTCTNVRNYLKIRSSKIQLDACSSISFKRLLNIIQYLVFRFIVIRRSGW